LDDSLRTLLGGNEEEMKKVITFMGNEYPIHGAEGAVCDGCKREENNSTPGTFRWHHGVPVGYFCDEHWNKLLDDYRKSH
jgi:hypothetical protein